MNNADRQPHAGYERPGRIEKATKIRRLIETRRGLEGADLLEVGCGSGWMASEFSRLAGPDGSVRAVDRIDQRKTDEGFDFTAVEATTLPYDDDSFDIAISNHVMEHVGESPDQKHHLAELARVLRPEGLLYLSVPNRWRVVEPHFHLPFLSWLPQRAASKYLSVVGKGDWYDVVPPSHRDMRRLLDESVFDWDDVTIDSMAVMAEVETTTRMERAVLEAPDPLVRAGYWFIPSMIYLATQGTS